MAGHLTVERLRRQVRSLWKLSANAPMTIRRLSWLGIVCMLPASALTILVCWLAGFLKEALWCFFVFLGLVWLYSVVRIFSNIGGRWAGKELLRFLFLQLIIIAVYAMAYSGVGLQNGIEGYRGIERMTDYPTALYFSFVTWTNLGHGSFHPAGAIRFIAVSEAYLGYVSMGVLVALVLFWLRGRQLTPAERGE